MEQQSVKKLKFWSIVLLTINSIIGTGIFLSPGSVVKKAGVLAPQIYLCAAIFAAVLSITFAAASKYVVKNGAAYAYSKAAFGENVGFYVGITRFVAASIAWGVMATAVVKITMSIFGLDRSNLVYVTIGFVILMGILFAINVFGTNLLARISDLSTIGKMTALVITIVAGVVILMIVGPKDPQVLNTLTNGDGAKLIPDMTTMGFATAIIAAFYAFTGFESIASGAADMEKPEKNLPKAIPLAIAIIAAIYFGIILVAMYLDPVALVESKEVVVLASVFKDKPFIYNIIKYGALVSMFGINVAASFHTPRILEAISREGQLPKFFDKRTDKGFPVTAFVLTVAFAIIIPMAFRYDMKGIMIISSISRFVQFIVVPLAVIAFFYGKNKENVLEAPKNFVTDVVFSIISLVLTVLLLWQFNWVGRFSITNAEGVKVANWYAIIAMFIGYVVLPVVLMIYNKSNKEK